MLAGRQQFGVLRWFQLFCFFHLVSAVCLAIREAIFCLPPAFVVCSFFLCHRHLWSVLSFIATGICVRSLSFMAFSAVGIRVRLFVFALLALVSEYQCISQFLVSCCALAACQLYPWRFELDFFLQVGYPVDSPTNSSLKQTPFGIPRLKVYEIAPSKVLATQMGVTEAQHKSQLRIWNVQIWPILATLGRFRGNSWIVLLWVTSELLQFAATQ